MKAAAPAAAARPSRASHSVRCQSCASFTAPHPSTYGSSYGSSADLILGPICPWPRAAPLESVVSTPVAQRAPQGRSLWEGAAAFFGLQEERQLPEEVEALALFSDAPEVAPAQGWAALWRYQGFK